MAEAIFARERVGGVMPMPTEDGVVFVDAANDTLYERWMSFLHAVDWTEPWLQGLLAAEVTMLLLVILTRKRATIQSVFFLVLLAVVYSAESLNAYLGAHWREFAGQNYFDRQGQFITTVLSAPVLLICGLMVINMLMQSADLLVKVKTMQLREEAAKRRAKKD